MITTLIIIIIIIIIIAYICHSYELKKSIITLYTLEVQKYSLTIVKNTCFDTDLE
jgi:hypothetical protein